MGIIMRKGLICLLFVATLPVSSQVLWTENFDGYNTGTFTTGQGGWDVTTYGSDIRIIAEPGRGNVLAWGWNQFPSPTGNSGDCSKKGFAALWNTRTAANNVLKLEFDFYSKDFTNSPGEAFQMGVGFRTLSGTSAVFRCHVNVNESYVDTPIGYRSSYNHVWVKVEVYMEYNTGTNTSYLYTYIPLLNHLEVYQISGSNILGRDDLRIAHNVIQPNKAFTGALMKYDNFRLSAIPTRPSHVSVNEWLAAKFNLYPNPATNVVNITNSENMLVNKVVIYDIAGKQLSAQSFSNETKVQLNVENLVSGTYMLHIQSDSGTAIKKLIKK